MDTSRRKSIAKDSYDTAASGERRRIGRVVHDDRGNATLKWHDAPADYKRTVLEVVSEPSSLAIQKPQPTFDPYARATPVGRPTPVECATSVECATPVESSKAAGPRKDLRKLSEWIKMMRELEERRARGDVE